MAFQMQARSSTDGQLYHWVAGSVDFAAAGYTGPGSAQDVAVAMRPSAGAGGGVTAHNLLSGLTTGDDHTQYELARRPIQPYTGTPNAAALADARRFITTSHGSANVLTIAKQATVAWLAETLLCGCNIGAGATTLTPEDGTVTLNGISLVVPSKAWWKAKRRSSNVWDVVIIGAATATGDFKADGTVPATGDFNLGGNQVGNAGDAVASTDLTTLQQVQALIAAGISTVFDVKPSARLATAAALPASTRVSNVRTANSNGALPNIDGVAPALNDRILDKDHATQADRGLWVVTSLGSGGTPWVLTRSTDADTNAEVTPGFAVIAEEGTANKGHCFILTTPAPFTVNTSSWTFADIGQVTGDGTTIQLVAGVLSLVAGGVGTSHLAAHAVSFAKFIAATAANKLVGSTAAGDFQELGFGGGIERSGTDLQVATTLPARGTCNYAVDAYPPDQHKTTLANGASVSFDYTIPASKEIRGSFQVLCLNGAGGPKLFKRALGWTAYLQSGVAAFIDGPDTVHEYVGAGTITLTCNVTGAVVRHTLTNSSGGTINYAQAMGGVSSDLP